MGLETVPMNWSLVTGNVFVHNRRLMGNEMTLNSLLILAETECL